MDEVSIEKAVIYRNGRSHCVFSDHSGLILHAGGSFITYFSRSGQATRQVTSCVTCSEDAKEKVFLLLELVNSVSLRPVAVLAEQVYAKDVRYRERAVEAVAWKIPSVLVVVEKDSRAQLASVSFDVPSHNRVEVLLDPSDGSLTLRSLDQLSSVSLSSDGLLLKVTYPLFLPEKRVISKSDAGFRGVAGSGIVFQYVDISQIFSSADYPEEWSRPVELLWHSFKAMNRTELRSPMFSAAQATAEDLAGEFCTALPTFSTGETWRNDHLSPAVSLLSYFDSPIFAVWTPEATLRNVPSLGIEGVIHSDQARLLCTDGGFFHFLAANEEPRSFSKDSVPMIIRSKSGNYSLQKVVEMCGNIVAQPVAAARLPQAEDTGEDPEGVKCENVVDDVGTFTAYNDGSMRALFNDRTVVRINCDLSVTVISRKGELLKLTLDNPFGYEAYVPVCLEFYEWAFTTPEEKARKQVKEAELKLISQMEVEKIDRLLGIGEVYQSFEE